MSLARTEEPQGTTPYRLVGGEDPKGRKSLVGSLGEMRVGAPAPNQNLRELDRRNARHPSRGGEETSPPGTKREPSSPSPPRDHREEGGREDPDTCGKGDTNPHLKRKPPLGKQARRGARRKTLWSLPPGCYRKREELLGGENLLAAE